MTNYLKAIQKSTLAISAETKTPVSKVLALLITGVLWLSVAVASREPDCDEWLQSTFNLPESHARFQNMTP
jgi:hypothetical protein